MISPLPPLAILELQTWARGDGLLGMRPAGKLGPRGDQLTVMRLFLPAAGGLPEQALRRGDATHTALLQRLAALGAQPVEPAQLQWRQNPAPVIASGSLWTLVQEAQFADLLDEQAPALEAEGWQIRLLSGFAHHSQAINAWALDLSPDEAAAARQLSPTALARRQGAWLLSLGIEVEGEKIDLAPLIADLLRRDKRWLRVDLLEEIDPAAVIRLRAPGGRRLHTPAAPLKTLLGQLLDLLGNSSALARGGPIRLNDWDADRLAAFDEAPGRWQIAGDAGLRALGQRLLAVGAPPPVAEPPGLGLQLRPYQLQGLAWLQYLRAQGLGGILADEMGLGKTAQALAHVWQEKLAGRLDRPALVIMPTSLLFNWQQEAARVAPGLRVLLLHGPDRAALWPQMAEHDLLLCSYGLVWRDLRALMAQPFHLLILDEAQAVKNAHARAARALRRLQARHRLAMTGTPLENHLGELWSQFDFLLPGLLGDARSFARHWRKPIEVNGEGPRARLLAARVRPFILRRKKDEVAVELPPRSEIIKRVSLQGQQKSLYESVRVAADHQVRRILARQGFGGQLISVLDAMLKLRQVCCDPHLLKGMSLPPGVERAKLDWLRETLPDWLAQGRRVLVFSQFTEMLGLLSTELRALQLPHLLLSGDTPAARRGEIVGQFQALQCPLLLASLKAGGVGLNLTAADTVLHLDPWWNPAVQAQASARAHRIGQDKPVFVYQLLVQGSIEERMLELQQRKRDLAEGVLGSDSGTRLDKFSAPDLERLLAPLEDADD
ncbi:DEAD/DEAH box helicase [Paucibacter sp. APW11]|uniref:DEAD/DEAH box helicase n=1 Tax=Roseateles aquae TaxID=3077235 RepID=A0ABU3PHE3_9BURK|nr:DEAD/DEAH box helicase [Paucibacter sp. APW11]MDT9001988.1 DEAD/DEAH box helicase [Paucibacter sp. APW11]